MIFTPLALGTAGVLYLFNRICHDRRNRELSTTDPEGEEDCRWCCGCCPRVFEERVREEELGIPLRRRDIQFYSSTSTFVSNFQSSSPDSLIYSDGGSVSSERSDGSETSNTGGIVSLPMIDGDIFDFHHPLILKSSSSNNNSVKMSSSPPVLLGLPGGKAVQDYSDYMNSHNQSIEGPGIVVFPVDFIKSKSSASKFDDSVDFDEQEMIEFDANYAREYESFLKKNKLDDIISLERGIPSERKVSFNGITSVRAFSVENGIGSNEEKE